MPRKDPGSPVELPPENRSSQTFYRNSGTRNGGYRNVKLLYFLKTHSRFVALCHNVGKECANSNTTQPQMQAPRGLREMFALEVVNGFSGELLDDGIDQRHAFHFVCAAVMMPYQNDVFDVLHLDDSL